MSGPKVNEKKFVGRNVAIALGIACIFLFACLGVALAYYNSYVNSYNSYVDDHHKTDDQYNSLQNQSNDLAGIVILHKQETWLDSQIVSLAAGYFFATAHEADHAGYVWFRLQGPTSGFSISVQGVYNGSTQIASILFGQTVDLRGDTSTFIPILPDPDLQFSIVNNGNQSITLNVTITCYY